MTSQHFVSFSREVLWNIEGENFAKYHNYDEETYNALKIIIKDKSLPIAWFSFCTYVDAEQILHLGFDVQHQQTWTSEACNVTFNILDKDSRVFRLLSHQFIATEQHTGKATCLTAGIPWSGMKELSQSVDQLCTADNSIRVLAEVKIIADTCLKVDRTFRMGLEFDVNHALDLDRLLQSNKFSDVKLISSDGKTFHAHKVLLVARSPVFATYFEKDAKKTSEIELADIDSQVLKAVLKYIYTGKYDELSAMAAELLPPADKYDIRGLKMNCERVLAAKLTIDNAIEFLIIANSCNAEYLKSRVEDLIVEHAHTFIGMPKFKEFEKSHSHLLGPLFCKFVMKK